MIKSKLLARYPELVWGVSTVGDGNMSFLFGEADEVVTHRRWFLQKLNSLAVDFYALRLGMVDRIDILTEADRSVRMLEFEEPEQKSDAAITVAGGPGIFLMTADCTPGVIYDPKKQVVAAVHMSWQCTDQELARKTVELMAEKFGSQPADLIAFLGPGIRKESYVHEDPSQRQDPRWQPFIAKVQGGYSIDVAGFNRHQLVQAGLKPENIEISPVDTATTKDYFSHYRSVRTGEPEGRFVTAVIVKPQ